VVEAFNGTGYGVLVPSYDEILHACTLQELADTGISTVTSIVAGTANADERSVADYTTNAANSLPRFDDGAGSL
jgi:hypothetical protein